MSDDDDSEPELSADEFERLLRQPPTKGDIESLQARARELLESLGLEPFFMALFDRASITNRGGEVLRGEDLVEDLLGRALLETGGGRLLALVAIRRESGPGFAGLLVSAQRPGHTRTVD